VNDHILYSDNQPEGDRWVAQFTSGLEPDRAPACLEPEMVARVVRLWLKVIIPEARVLEAEEAPIQRISFVRRRDLRRFLSNWGGQMVAPSNRR
jgi:hypothetical protein